MEEEEEREKEDYKEEEDKRVLTCAILFVFSGERRRMLGLVKTSFQWRSWTHSPVVYYRGGAGVQLGSFGFTRNDLNSMN